MPLSERNTVVFAYESSVHSFNVLLSLNEQRKQDLFCDVTILVEDQRFRVHRSVLAACSSYFRSRIVGQVEPDLIITLPEEVTLKGFGPLLQFAYTSKLILDKDNVAEVCKCAEFLGVHDIEESCFQFLKFKFLDHKLGRREYQRKKCCKSRCQKEEHKVENASDNHLEIDSVNESLQNECIDAQLKNYKSEKNPEVSLAQDNTNQRFESDSERGQVLDSASLCPKYRKFQKALEGDKAPTSESNSSIEEVQVISAASVHQIESYTSGATQRSFEYAAVPQDTKCEDSQVEMEEDGKEEFLKQTASAFQSTECSTEKSVSFSPHNSSVATHGLYSTAFLNTCDQYCDLTLSSMPCNAEVTEKVTEKTSIVTEAEYCKPISKSPDESLPLKSHLCDREALNDTSPCNRSSVEREVAEHLAKGFWSDIYNPDATCQISLSPASDQVCSEKKAECPWLGIRISDSPEHSPQRTFTTLSSVNCPFINNLSTGNSTEISSGDCVQEQQQEQCPYSCVISLEEDSETDTEGDSESCSAREQECEVKLPFDAQKIISLSRNDFQSCLKMHKLTPEQLDCIHDIRRRSKNRIAAQRCRKRKLDCLQNLESEIEKLQSEKESLLKEKDHILSTLSETKQNLTGLCQQVCKEAALSHEQIQILAKYSTSDCPLLFLIPEKEQPAPPDMMSTVPLCIELSKDLCVESPDAQSSSYLHVKSTCDTGYPQAQELCPVPIRISEKTLCLDQCVQSGGAITDFCQQMTDKCTTE
ncbi:transcription regulator protein BACH1 [Sphaerodactylus townsendi]|uniref:transcription regulator protein BACH1 n=1 Tax=Sphaerodactylus townsendi TaxID=933632 RepID=UPI002025D612|nr:transcription regulator protein BACH1 [Sphaerodactylus townsendi]XP_048350244.1 transcription regulator protein BACH1 [Sphaerodactylus townsendi]XP_048350246.1 transcription regulator protein BACH1 [Sphaerodactylus townsendi]